MVKSLRGLGYKPATAVADLVDNSLSAGASQIQIEFIWGQGDPKLRVTDNGRGMTAAELVDAMRFGKDPEAPRAPEDLGRFGFGLKTASLSQARILTVCSKAMGQPPAIRRWDIDHIDQADNWDLLEGTQAGSESLIQPAIEQENGTVVLLEKPDGLLAGTDGSIDSLFEIADVVSKHLAMVFHRFIADGGVVITVNNTKIRAWDPFMSEHPDCVVSGPDTVQNSAGDRKIVVTGYVLPSKAKLTAEEFEQSAGPNGWIGQEGFYLYRADRLVVAGGWLGLGKGGSVWRPDRNFALARISVDIANSSDFDWSIDVRKSMASPPEPFRTSLRQIAEEIRRRSKSALRMSRNGGEEKVSAASVSPIWMESVGPAKQFRINRRHPAVRKVRELGGDANALRALLRLIDKEVPIIPRVPVTLPGGAIEAGRALQDISIRRLVRTLYYSLKNSKGLTVADAIQEILAQPTFSGHAALVVLTIEEYEREMKV